MAYVDMTKAACWPDFVAANATFQAAYAADPDSQATKDAAKDAFKKKNDVHTELGLPPLDGVDMM
jgi:hypothetical protein